MKANISAIVKEAICYSTIYYDNNLPIYYTGKLSLTSVLSMLYDYPPEAELKALSFQSHKRGFAVVFRYKTLFGDYTSSRTEVYFDSNIPKVCL
jgi:hypothetical protein